MGLLPDWRIRSDIKIEPFEEGLARPGVISFGVSSYGYDLRLGSTFRICDRYADGIIDPKNFDPDLFHRIDGRTCVIPPHGFALAESLEYLEIPADVLGVCTGKSTYARCGLIVNVTPLEPRWRGKVTIEISNTTPLPARLYAGEGICQVLFLRGEHPCERTYADKGGRYQDQKGLTFPFVDGGKQP